MDGPRLVLGASQASVRMPTGDIGSKRKKNFLVPARIVQAFEPSEQRTRA